MSQPAPYAQFTVGPTLRHVVVMAATGWLGLAAIFIVDFINLFYISLLGRTELTAAIGFSGGLLFLLTSIGIGTVISGTALVSRTIGARNRPLAREIAASSLLQAALFMTTPALLILIYLRPILSLMGARDETLDVAVQFMTIVLPAMPLMAIGMMLSGVLRAVADARRAMHVTLIGGLATLVLDPLFIFVFHLGITGAAIVTVLSRIVLVAVGVSGAIRVHKMVAWPTWASFRRDFRPLFAIGLPAILTNLATPVGSIYTTAVVAGFGADAIAGGAVLDRLVPLAFGGVFALSGAIGPILGQNYGARQFHRLKRVVTESVILTVVYCTLVWALLALLAPVLISQFGVVGDGAVMVLFFCHWTSGTFIFTGLMFVANSVFNNLGFPVLSTVFNWGRATLGTIPFVHVGAIYMGVIGVSLGWGLGAVVFGVGSLWATYHVLGTVEARSQPKSG
jgi:putative MATE family efflux protein